MAPPVAEPGSSSSPAAVAVESSGSSSSAGPAPGQGGRPTLARYPDVEPRPTQDIVAEAIVMKQAGEEVIPAEQWDKLVPRPCEGCPTCGKPWWLAAGMRHTVTTHGPTSTTVTRKHASERNFARPWRGAPFSSVTIPTQYRSSFVKSFPSNMSFTPPSLPRLLLPRCRHWQLHSQRLASTGPPPRRCCCGGGCGCSRLTPRLTRSWQ